MVRMGTGLISRTARAMVMLSSPGAGPGPARSRRSGPGPAPRHHWRRVVATLDRVAGLGAACAPPAARNTRLVLDHEHRQADERGPFMRAPAVGVAITGASALLDALQRTAHRGLGGIGCRCGGEIAGMGRHARRRPSGTGRSVGAARRPSVPLAAAPAGPDDGPDPARRRRPRPGRPARHAGFRCRARTGLYARCHAERDSAAARAAQSRRRVSTGPGIAPVAGRVRAQFTRWGQPGEGIADACTWPRRSLSALAAGTLARFGRPGRSSRPVGGGRQHAEGIVRRAVLAARVGRRHRASGRDPACVTQFESSPPSRPPSTPPTAKPPSTEPPRRAPCGRPRNAAGRQGARTAAFAARPCLDP